MLPLRRCANTGRTPSVPDSRFLLSQRLRIVDRPNGRVLSDPLHLRESVDHPPDRTRQTRERESKSRSPNSFESPRSRVPKLTYVTGTGQTNSSPGPWASCLNHRSDTREHPIPALLSGSDRTAALHRTLATRHVRVGQSVERQFGAICGSATASVIDRSGRHERFEVHQYDCGGLASGCESIRALSWPRTRSVGSKRSKRERRRRSLPSKAISDTSNIIDLYGELAARDGYGYAVRDRVGRRRRRLLWCRDRRRRRRGMIEDG